MLPSTSLHSYLSQILNYVNYYDAMVFRVGDHVTFVYDNIVSQQIVLGIFFDLSFKILLFFIDHVSNSIDVFHYCSFTFLVMLAQTF